MLPFNTYQYHDMIVRNEDFYANAKYKIIINYLKKRKYKNLRILNAGCGSGELSFLLAAAGHDVIGFDPGAEYIAMAKKNLPEDLSRHCSFSVSTIQDFKNTGTYDCVIATDVLEHIKDDESALKKMTTMVCKGGLLIVTVPALNSLYGYHDEQLGHFRRYNKKQLRSVVNNVGILSIDRLRYFGFVLIPICYLFSKKLRRPYPISKGGLNFLAICCNLVLKMMLWLESRIYLPLGTSLICFNRKKNNL